MIVEEIPENKCISPILSQSAHSFHNVLQYQFYFGEVWKSYLNQKAGYYFTVEHTMLVKRTQCYCIEHMNKMEFFWFPAHPCHISYKLPIVFLCILEITQSLNSSR